MARAALGTPRIPAEAGAVTDRFIGESPYEYFLVGAQAGHPPATELTVMATLNVLHALQPIERLFITFDASEKTADFEPEIDVSAYRGFADAEIRTEVTQHLVGEGFVSAGKGFAITCEPATRLTAIDDWYGWASQKDALDVLNSEAGVIVLVAKLIDYGTQSGNPARDLLSVIRLAMTGEEWRSQRERIAALDPTAVLADLRSSISEGFDQMAGAFTDFQANAIRFYQAGVTRVQAVVRGAIDSMSQSGATRGAIVLGLPWMETAAALLRRENVGFVRVIPDGIAMAPMLDEAGVFVGEPSDYQRRAQELFTGRRVRGRIEALSTRTSESRARLAEVWVMAGRGLTLAGDWTRADECFNRALVLHRVAHTYSWAGAHAVNQRQYERALPLLRRAVRLDPLSAESWGTYGLALAGIGKHGAALRALVTSVRLASSTGSLWCHLGLFYHHRGRTAAACYAFARGRDLGDADSAHNFSVVCGSGGYPCPRELRPSVRWQMRRLGLSLRRSVRRLRSRRSAQGGLSGPVGRRRV